VLGTTIGVKPASAQINKADMRSQHPRYGWQPQPKALREHEDWPQA